MKSTSEPAPHPPLPDPRFPVRRRGRSGRRRALRVIGRRRTVQLLRLGLRRDLAVAGVEVHPRGAPHDGSHPAVAQRPHHRLRLRELMRVELPAVVLGRPRRVEHDRVERDSAAAESVEVVEHRLAILVDVTALPVAVTPLRQEHREAGSPTELAQPRGRRPRAQELQPQRSGLSASRYRRPVARHVEPGPVGRGQREDSVAAARQHPRHRSAITLRDAAGREHLRRTVGPGVAPVGAQLDGAAALVELGAVAHAQSDEVLVRAPIPVERQTQRRPLRGQARTSAAPAPGAGRAGVRDGRLRSAGRARRRPGATRPRRSRRARAGHAMRARGAPGPRPGSRPR